MDGLRHFFRIEENNFVFQRYGIVHLLILLFFIGVLYIIKNKKLGLDIKENNQKFLYYIAVFSLIDQIVLYVWELTSGRFQIHESLPLYHCRIAFIFMFVSILTGNRLLKIMTIFWGTLGSSFAMFYPDLYPFDFPHFTNFQFFIVHIILGWIVFDFLFVEKIKLNKKDLKDVLIFTNVFNLIVFAANFMIVGQYPDVNYGYFMSLPGGYTLQGSHLLHSIVMMIVFNIGMVILYNIFNF